MPINKGAFALDTGDGVYTDSGCKYFDACLSCPLVVCHQDFTDNGGVGGIIRAIRYSWEKGLRDPRLQAVYERVGGAAAKAPDDLVVKPTPRMGRPPKKNWAENPGRGDCRICGVNMGGALACMQDHTGYRSRKSICRAPDARVA